MIIDFHTHVFPDKIAKPTIDFLASKSGYIPYGDGTLQSLISLMDKGNIDKSVILPVVTKPSQFDSVNKFAAELNDTERLWAFGGIHPADETPEAHLDEIKKMGLYGIKLHPDYQNAFIDDERYIRIIRYALSIDLAVITHAGIDDGCEGDVKCTPDRILRVFDEIYKGSTPAETRLILAHGGGFKMHSEVIQKLCGLPVYFDLAYISEFTDPETLLSIIQAHGSDKILFASDSPWSDPGTSAERLRALSISEDDLNRIFFQNALTVLRK
ncbi:MAG: amidohydrolase family protein [Oscillospiraceae bacterium]|nr:amidohydrolase family protein [Oscillospiraceae bacterium]